ncbi:recombination mediator RecR [bacterium]|nr:recombination mediator RecR [bacterium]
MLTPIERLTQELAKLPGIGHKTALRLVLHILRQPSHYAQSLSQALADVSAKVRFCEECFHFTDEPLCPICRDKKRDHHLLCVVEDSSDLMAVERTHSFKGVYHVLHGSLSPIDGIGPNELRIQELMARLQKQEVHEIILATNPNISGDATALYISKLLKPMGLKMTRLANGIPVGGHIEYIDQMTLSRAFESRVEC